MLRGLQQMDCASFLIWVRRVKIRTTFTYCQLALEKSSNVTEALEQREFRFRPLETCVSELNFYFFSIAKDPLHSLEAGFGEMRLSRERRASPALTAIPAAGPAGEELAWTQRRAGSARHHGARVSSKQHPQRLRKAPEQHEEPKGGRGGGRGRCPRMLGELGLKHREIPKGVPESDNEYLWVPGE